MRVSVAIVPRLQSLDTISREVSRSLSRAISARYSIIYAIRGGKGT